jgi:hypothetical protein
VKFSEFVTQMISWMIAGLAFEIIGCSIRAVYLAGGPIYSSNTFSYQANSYLLNLTIIFEVMAVRFVFLFLFLLIFEIFLQHFSKIKTNEILTVG